MILVIAMSFNTDIFKHPAVEYIPLAINTIAENPVWQKQNESRRPQVNVWQDEKAMQSGLALQAIPAPAVSPDFRSNIIVLVTDASVQDVKYRANTVYLVSTRKPGSYHLFRLTKRYFYKNRLHFAVYEHSGQKLAWDNIILSSISRRTK